MDKYDEERFYARMLDLVGTAWEESDNNAKKISWFYPFRKLHSIMVSFIYLQVFEMMMSIYWQIINKK